MADIDNASFDPKEYFILSKSQVDEEVPLTHVMILCNDDKVLVAPRDQVARCPFLKPQEGGAKDSGSSQAGADEKAAAASEDKASSEAAAGQSAYSYTFDYPAPVLERLVRWAAHHGVAGQAASPLPRPCIYPDFQYVLTDPWEKAFYLQCLWPFDAEKYHLITLNAAEKYGMKGLADFMSVFIGCRLRNGDDEVLLHEMMGLEYGTDITEEELNKVDTDYPWLAEATRPSTQV